MKKLLLFAILAFSINVFAQNHRPIPFLPHPVSHSPEMNPWRPDDGGTVPSTFIDWSVLNPDPDHQLPGEIALIQIKDSVFFWNYDTLGNEWINNSKLTNYVYDAKNNLSSYDVQTWYGIAWENSYQITYSYDAANKSTGYVQKNWNGIGWDNFYQLIYTYDGSQNRTLELHQIWEGNAWKNVWQYSYFFNSGNKMTLSLVQFWNGTAWLNVNQYTYTYDAGNNMTSYLPQTWNGSAWVNTYQ